MKRLAAGAARPLGAALAKRGVNFALFSSRASRVQVCLFDPVGGAELERFDLPARTGDVWHGLVPAAHAGPGTHYAFHVHGPESPQPGDRFDPAIALIDPYARALSRTLPLRSVVVDAPFDWKGDRPPAVAWRNTVMYELHVKGFTALHPGVPEPWRGKYLGLTVASVIEHLKSIGVTAVELLPCQAFISEQFLLERRLANYWGYNSIAWFAPANEYAVLDAVAEFKAMVKALHAAGIEVILDVVFNHTAEGNEHGTTYQPARHRQPGLLPADARGAASLRECHRLRQHGQLRSSGGARADHRLPQVLGRGDARRRIPLRPGNRAGARRQRLQRTLAVLPARCASCPRSRM